MSFRRATFFAFLVGSSLVFAAVKPVKPAEVVEPGPGKPLWQACDACANPESAYYDPESGFLFVANVNGNPTDKDGNGFIQQYTIHGKVVEPKWVGGLNAPKGLRAHKGTLWLSDIDELVGIDVASAKVIKRIAVPDAAFLNDIAISGDGTLYVSDTVKGRITVVKGDKVSTFLEGKITEHPNGLLINGKKLIVAGWGLDMAPDWSTKTPGNLFAIDLKTKKKNLITKKPLGNLDGLELLPSGEYLTSDWAAGKVYRVSAKGKVEVIGTGYQGSADIGYVAPRNLLIVPRMNENLISAYELGKGVAH